MDSGLIATYWMHAKINYYRLTIHEVYLKHDFLAEKTDGKYYG